MLEQHFLYFQLITKLFVYTLIINKLITKFTFLTPSLCLTPSISL